MENRYSSLRNSPSGNFLVHPKSRVPDHPAEIISQRRDMHETKTINPSFSLTNVVQARNFINATPVNMDPHQYTFNQRSMSLQPAPLQE